MTSLPMSLGRNNDWTTLANSLSSDMCGQPTVTGTAMEFGLDYFCNMDAVRGSTCMDWSDPPYSTRNGLRVDLGVPITQNSYSTGRQAGPPQPSPTFVSAQTHAATRAAASDVSRRNSRAPRDVGPGEGQDSCKQAAPPSEPPSADLGASCHSFVHSHGRLNLQPKRNGELVIGFQNVLSLDASEWRECTEKGLNETIRLRWIAKKIATKGIDIFGMVETRLPDDSHFHMDSHLVIGFRAIAGRDGQMILLDNILKPKVVWKEALSERVSRVKVLLLNIPMIVVLAHGPVATSPEDTHQAFREQLMEALSSAREEGDSVILLADMNARFDGCQVFQSIGEMAVSKPIGGDEERTQLLARGLAEQGIWLTNTHVWHDHPHTWHHASGFSAQIDYVGLSRHLHGLVEHVVVEPRQDWISSCMSDHDVLLVVINKAWKPDQAPAKRKGKGGSKPLKNFVNEDHRRSFIESFAAYQSTMGQPSGPSSNRFSSLINDAARVLNETAPQRCNKPKRDWISEESWTLVRRVAENRKQLKVASGVWGRNLLLRAWQTWRGPDAGDRLELGLGMDFVTWTVHRFRLRCALFTSLRSMRKRSKKDRKHWMQQECQEMQNLVVAGKIKEYYAKLNRLTKRKTTQHGILKGKTGHKAYTTKEVAQVWSDHWCEVFAAHEKDVLVDFNNFDVSAAARYENASAITEQEVWRAMMSSANGKASPDMVAIDVLKTISDAATPLLSDMYTQYLQTSCVPNAFKGGVIVPVHKKGNWTDPSNFRPICLMSNIAKMFNRVILERLGLNEMEPTQFSGPRSSVEFPILCSGMLLQYLRRHNIGAAFLFLDVQQAYDN
eukprot:326027-Amphidinium_carterae.1